MDWANAPEILATPALPESFYGFSELDVELNTTHAHTDTPDSSYEHIVEQSAPSVTRYTPAWQR